MSAKKARQIKSVFKREGVVYATVRDNDDPTSPLVDVSIFDLPRHELIKAAVKCGLKPNSESGRWMGVDNDDIQSMILAKYKAGFSRSEQEQGEGGDDMGDQHEEGDYTPPEDSTTPEGEGQGDDDPLAPSEFEFEVPEELQVNSTDDLETQADKLKRALEQRNEAREEYEKEEARKEQARKERDEAREQEEQQRREQEQHEQEEQQQFFEDFSAKKQALDIPTDVHPQIHDILDALMLGQDVYLAGPPGTGKSYLTELCAQILNRRYYSISFGPQTPESRLWGYHDAQGRYVRTPFREWYDSTTANDDGAIFCGDEIDNGNAGITTTSNQALAGSGATFPDGWVDRHIGARMMTTANTWGQGATAEFMGRNPLDAAFLDRFTKFEIPTDEELEYKLVKMNSNLTEGEVASWIAAVHQLRANAEKYKIRAVVSMRTAITGAQLRSIGWDTRKVLNARVLTGLPESRVEHLMEGVL